MTLKWSGERYIPGVPGDIEVEHKHRYHLAVGIAKNKVVLDLACGEGYGTAMLSTVAKQVVGIDISQDTVLHANSKYNNSSIEFKLGDCQSLPIEDNSIDLVVSFETIEHHDKHHEMLSEIIRVLKPDGLLLISSPDRDEYAKTRTGDNEFHVKELSAQEFTDLLKMYFKRVDFYAQRVVNASAISPADKTSPGEFRHIVTTMSGDVERRYIHPIVYHVALAGNVNNLPKLGTSLYEIDDSDQSLPQAGSIRVDLLIDNPESDSAHFDDRALPATSATFPFDTRIHEISLKIPHDLIRPARIGVGPADQPCALALHECSFISSDNRLLWHWDGRTNPFSLSDFAVFIPGEDKTSPLIVSLSNHPLAWFQLPEAVVHELRGGVLRFRVAGFTLFDPQTLNRLHAFIHDNLAVSDVNESNPLSPIEVHFGILGKLADLLSVARNSMTLRDALISEQNKKLHHLRQEIIRAEAQLDLLKEVAFGRLDDDSI